MISKFTKEQRFDIFTNLSLSTHRHLFREWIIYSTQKSKAADRTARSHKKD